MKNGTLRIYALAVCFSTLMCGAISAGIFIFSLVKVVAPELTIEPSSIR